MQNKFKFYSSDRLKSLLDENTAGDNGSFMRSILLDRFKRQNSLKSLSIARVNNDGEIDANSEDDAEASFSHRGCDVCSHGLGNNVYPTIGWNGTEVIEAGDVCHQCLCVEYNGID